MHRTAVAREQHDHRQQTHGAAGVHVGPQAATPISMGIPTKSVEKHAAICELTTASELRSLGTEAPQKSTVGSLRIY